MHKFLLKMFTQIRNWIPLTVAVTMTCGLVYVTAQQIYRQSANDPQIQLSEDTARDLESNQPEKIVPSANINISKSLNTFLIVYDQSGQPVLSQAVLDGKIPSPPAGVFEYVSQNGEDKITWQPKNGVRIAAVVNKYQSASGSGFVLAGRSLREVENRVDQLGIKVLIAWVITLATTFFANILFSKYK